MNKMENSEHQLQSCDEDHNVDLKWKHMRAIMGADKVATVQSAIHTSTCRISAALLCLKVDSIGDSKL